jgi:uncharacterized OB-fold protein
LSTPSLPDSGEISTYTRITVATPQFEDDAPFVTAIVDFGPVRLTGQVRGVDPDEGDVGLVVGATTGRRATTDDRLVESFSADVAHHVRDIQHTSIVRVYPKDTTVGAA